MAYVYLDRLIGGDEKGAPTIVCAWYAGAAPRKEKRFPAELRNVAEAFAVKKMGARGQLVSTLDMDPAQLQAHAESNSRFLDAMATLVRGRPAEHEAQQC